jgi:ribulose-phosphate 3-epimerase
MIKIVPAVLVKTKEEYSQRLAVIRQLTDRFQLDVIDSDFVDNPTFDIHEVARPSDLKIDLDMMVGDPRKYYDQILRIHPYTTILHFECQVELAPVIEKLKKSGLRAGLAINPETPVKKVKNLLENLDYFQIMGYPAGFSGQKFQAEVLDKIDEIKKLKADIEIGLDGGVSEKTLKKICSTELDVINANSYLFETEDVLNRYSTILAECL